MEQMIKVKNNQITAECLKSFKEICEYDIPIELAFTLSIIADHIERIARNVEKTSAELLNKCVEKNEDGTWKPSLDLNGNPIPEMWMLLPDKKDYYNSEFEKLGELVNEIPVKKISLSDLKITEVKPKHIFNIRFIFTDYVTL